MKRIAKRGDPTTLVYATTPMMVHKVLPLWMVLVPMVGAAALSRAKTDFNELPLLIAWCKPSLR
jgi:hypothetical protein